MPQIAPLHVQYPTESRSETSIKQQRKGSSIIDIPKENPKTSNRPLVLRAGPPTLSKPTTIHEWRSRPYRTTALHPITILEISKSSSAPHLLATWRIDVIPGPSLTAHLSVVTLSNHGRHSLDPHVQ
ncbi:hypothetical protein Salat_1247600 [Sesamum alatum]|uniref:Uncharacterized protein n=1 Tax=Sesamum alatum TaxID=300844 RepID=A0AAE2CP86_9LAMI|nr:hypothetical protein Salat_1247600 [Sesamum alatum]